MTPALLAAHDPLDHVLPHRFGEPLIHWNIDWTSPLNIVSITPHDTYFTNQMMMCLVAAGNLLLILPLMGRRYAVMLRGGADRCVPSGFSGALEGIMAFLRDGVARPVLGDKTDGFMPFIWTVFFYILTCNLLGMVPFDSIIYLISGGKLQHIGGTATANIMITAGLAFCAFLMIHLSGVQEIFTALVQGTYGHHHHEKEHEQLVRVETSPLSALVDAAEELGHNHGHHKESRGGHSDYAGHHHGHGGMSYGLAIIAAPAVYLWNFAPHVFKPERMEGVGSLILWVADLVMWAVLLLLELVGAMIKPFALAIRLFANMVAGHVVLASILALIFVFKGSVAANYGMGVVSSLGAAALNLLELFVAFLQAYVFTFLTTLFIGAAVAPEH